MNIEEIAEILKENSSTVTYSLERQFYVTKVVGYETIDDIGCLDFKTFITFSGLKKYRPKKDIIGETILADDIQYEVSYNNLTELTRFIRQLEPNEEVYIAFYCEPLVKFCANGEVIIKLNRPKRIKKVNI